MPTARAYWVPRPGVGELRGERVAAEPATGRSLVRAECSGVSAGTEKLVGLGLVPEDCAEAMACNYMGGDFRLPIKYGYSLVGTGVAGGLSGQRVFVMHPHQELLEVADADVVQLPDTLPSLRALLIPNLETALNAVWDAEPEAGERAVIVGGGSVGLLVGHVVAGFCGSPAVLVDSDAARREAARELSWFESVRAPDEVRGAGFELAFHTSGSPLGLQTALDAVGFEGRVLELSWYGSRRVELDLGSHFHYQRKRILASQVATIARSRRATHGHAERMQEVLRRLEEPELDGLLGAAVDFARMPALMDDLYRGRARDPLPTIAYGA